MSFFQDDFLLRHYDKGPCKDKLGHSRASVIWHRTQVSYYLSTDVMFTRISWENTINAMTTDALAPCYAA